MDGLTFALEEGTTLGAEMGGGAGEEVHEWFDLMYADAQTNGRGFTAIGLRTPIRLAYRAFWHGRTFYRIAWTI